MDLYPYLNLCIECGATMECKGRDGRLIGKCPCCLEQYGAPAGNGPFGAVLQTVQGVLNLRTKWPATISWTKTWR